MGTFILLRHSLRRARTLVLGLALVLSGFQLVLTAVAASLQRTNAFGPLASMIPEFFRQFVGPSTRLLLSLVANLGALAWCWAGVAMAIAARASRRSVAGAATGVIALAAFLVDYVGRAWPAAQMWARLSPFHYFSPLELVMGTSLRPADVAVLLAVGCGGIAASYVLFARRDI